MYEDLGEDVQTGRGATDVESRKSVHTSKDVDIRPNARSNLPLGELNAFEAREQRDEGEEV